MAKTATATEIAAIEALAGSDLPGACDAARKLVEENPYDESASALLTDLVSKFASQPHSRIDRYANFPDELREAARLLGIDENEPAEIIVRSYLASNPDDVRAMSMMAEIASRCEIYDSAIKILDRAGEIDPQSVDVMLTRAKLLNHLSYLEHSQDRGEEALKVLDEALQIEPENIKIVSLYASILVRFRRFDESIKWYRWLLKLEPVNWLAWTNFGMMLNSIGDFGGAIAALRTATAIDPVAGTAWWEIANLKVSRFSAADIERMRQALKTPELDERSQSAIHFALARAMDQLGDLDGTAENLRLGNAIKKEMEPHDPDLLTRDVDTSIRTFSADFLAARAPHGDQRPDPIFIVGLQRSGTTLVEQILASHSDIEGTEELFILLQMAKEVSARDLSIPWQESLARRPLPEMASVGAGFLYLAEHYRVSGAAHFIDKNPTNWRFAGLIMSVLPNAKIIDVRRNPMDCCFANWTQNYQHGLGFAYSLENLGRYYRDYLRLMRHLEAVAPGRIHRVIYDDLVDDLETNVRGILDYLGLPFEESCLRFYETDRPVLTPSAQQVRQPINRSGLGRSARYEPYLGELRNALGDALTHWRD